MSAISERRRRRSRNLQCWAPANCPPRPSQFTDAPPPSPYNWLDDGTITLHCVLFSTLLPVIRRRWSVPFLLTPPPIIIYNYILLLHTHTYILEPPMITSLPTPPRRWRRCCTEFSVSCRWPCQRQSRIVMEARTSISKARTSKPLAIIFKVFYRVYPYE